MNQTPSFEDIAGRLISQPDFLRKFLIGGLLCFVPGVNFLAFGYLYRLSRSARESGSCKLPEWEDWSGLFYDGLRFLLAAILYWLVPVLAIWGLAALWELLPIWVIGPLIGFLLMSVGIFFAPLLFASALYRLQMNSDLSDLLDITLILKMTLHRFPKLVIPGLCLTGLTIAGLPLYGLVFFFGCAFLLVYTSFVFRSLENRRFSSF